jgi:hypothetical protein
VGADTRAPDASSPMQKVSRERHVSISESYCVSIATRVGTMGNLRDSHFDCASAKCCLQATRYTTPRKTGNTCGSGWPCATCKRRARTFVTPQPRKSAILGLRVSKHPKPDVETLFPPRYETSHFFGFGASIRPNVDELPT